MTFETLDFPREFCTPSPVTEYPLLLLKVWPFLHTASLYDIYLILDGNDF